jgi:hypothetical protein
MQNSHVIGIAIHFNFSHWQHVAGNVDRAVQQFAGARSAGN